MSTSPRGMPMSGRLASEILYEPSSQSLSLITVEAVGGPTTLELLSHTFCVHDAPHVSVRP